MAENISQGGSADLRDALGSADRDPNEKTEPIRIVPDEPVITLQGDASDKGGADATLDAGGVKIDDDSSHDEADALEEAARAAGGTGSASGGKAGPKIVAKPLRPKSAGSKRATGGTRGTSSRGSGSGARTDAVPPGPADPVPPRSADPAPRGPDPIVATPRTPRTPDDAAALMAELARLREEHDRKKTEFEAKLAEFTRVKEEERAADAALADARVSPMLDLLARSGPLHDPLAIATLRNTLAAFPEEVPPAGASDDEKWQVLQRNERVKNIMRQFAAEEFALRQHGERVTDIASIQAIMRSRLEHQEKDWVGRVGVAEAFAWAGAGGAAGMTLAGLATLLTAAPFVAAATPLAIAGLVGGAKFGLLKHRWDTHNLHGKGKHMWHESPGMWAAVVGGLAAGGALTGSVEAGREVVGTVVHAIASGAGSLGRILRSLAFLRL